MLNVWASAQSTLRNGCPAQYSAVVGLHTAQVPSLPGSVPSPDGAMGERLAASGHIGRASVFASVTTRDLTCVNALRGGRAKGASRVHIPTVFEACGGMCG